MVSCILQKEYIGVETSTKDAKVGEFVIFHVRANFNPETFHYLVSDTWVTPESGMSDPPMTHAWE